VTAVAASHCERKGHATWWIANCDCSHSGTHQNILMQSIGSAIQPANVHDTLTRRKRCVIRYSSEEVALALLSYWGSSMTVTQRSVTWRIYEYHELQHPGCHPASSSIFVRRSACTALSATTFPSVTSAVSQRPRCKLSHFPYISLGLL
jgi:hypothetical protein